MHNGILALRKQCVCNQLFGMALENERKALYSLVLSALIEI
jgi:hypothetical protein